MHQPQKMTPGVCKYSNLGLYLDFLLELQYVYFRLLRRELDQFAKEGTDHIWGPLTIAFTPFRIMN